MRITVTGASGFIGTALSKALTAAGHQVHPVSRSRPGLPPCDAVVHLAGENVAQRWTPAAKQRIRESRVEGTQALVRSIESLNPRPSILICASAIGYYGDRFDQPLTETAGAGKGFLSEVCVEWERSAQLALKLGLRVVCARFGIILGRNGGALAKMLPIFRLGLGGPIAGGRQWMSWVHLHDVTGILLHALHTDIAGAVNVTAPHPARNADFTKALARTLHRPAIFPVPALALRMLYGEMSEMLTGGQLVLPAAATQAGYRFQFDNLEAALADAVR